jgi:hypothetical protein
LCPTQELRLDVVKEAHRKLSRHGSIGLTMRHVAAVLAVVALLIVLWWQLSWAGRPEFERMIPEDVLAVLIVNKFPESLDFLEETRLSEWVEIELGTQPELTHFYQSDLVALFQDSVESLWISINRLHSIDTGEYRIEFTAFIEPRWGAVRSLEEQIADAVLERFGRDDASIVQEGEAKVFRGKEVGHLFYLRSGDGYLMMSNNESGWFESTLASSGAVPSLAGSVNFQEILANVDCSSDLFLFVRASDVYGLFPEFGYSVNLGEGGVEDNYYEIRE